MRLAVMLSASFFSLGGRSPYRLLSIYKLLTPLENQK